ncbi:hypothetical protein EV130_101185 [Rhizobium azibense]|uniref:Uncharacterized protein n=1 Tax=Rhizobium azibense TaxID=1136135 RepID=A0A4R3S125_9HYPH|nr:hypothetical protein EV130_101185 [Rhizobium azibense]TCU41374.1 hypothetical protein EV129_101665 [Rhizobium azibense]
MTTVARNQHDTALEVQQVGAICCRRDKRKRLEVLLVGSKRNGRWGVTSILARPRTQLQLVKRSRKPAYPVR